MTDFPFRLQPLLKLREADRNRRREELAVAYDADRQLAARAEELQGEMRAIAQRNRQQSQPGTINVDHLLQSHRFTLLVQNQLTHIARQRQQVKVEIERRREALVEADRELKILEKLKERLTAEHRRQAAIQEHKELDEVAARRQHRFVGGDSR